MKRLFDKKEQWNTFCKTTIHPLVKRRINKLYSDILKDHPTISLIDLQHVVRLESDYTACHGKLIRNMKHSPN